MIETKQGARDVLSLARELTDQLLAASLPTHNAVVNVMATLLQNRATVEQLRAAEEQQRAQVSAQLGMATAPLVRN